MFVGEFADGKRLTHEKTGLDHARTLHIVSWCDELWGIAPSVKKIGRGAIETSLTWTRMSPLPESAKNIDVLVEGSMFTREFEVEFEASEEEIKAWLADSPGTAVSYLPRYASAKETISYKIDESEALFAQVTVDWETLTVVIHTYWS